MGLPSRCSCVQNAPSKFSYDFGIIDACSVGKEGSAGAGPPEDVGEHVPDGTTRRANGHKMTLILGLDQIHRKNKGAAL